MPTIIVEFVSSGKVNQERDYIAKRAEYREIGVRQYWVIDRFRRTLTVYDFGGEKDEERVIPEGTEVRDALASRLRAGPERLLALADRWAKKKPRRQVNAVGDRGAGSVRRQILFPRGDMATENPRAPMVGVVMGSKSDWETMRHACEVLAELGIPYEAKVVSAHRTPERLFRYGREAEGRGLEVLIAGAGGAAHLPGMLASITLLPVLGVPVESRVLRGSIRCCRSCRCRGACRSARWLSAARRGQRGDPGRGHPARKDPGDPRGPGRGSARRRPTPWGSRPNERESRSIGCRARDRPPLFPPASLGVIGSGQLGRMFIQAAQRMGYRAGVLSESEDTPAAQVAHWTVIGRDDRLPAVAGVRERAEAVTVEFENVSAPALRWLARHRPVRPGWRTVWVAQNRLREKRFLARHGIPHAPWRPVRTAAELDDAVRASACR